MKGSSAAVGATAPDKIWLKHSFMHCSVPKVVNLSMAIFFLECVMMVPSPFIKKFGPNSKWCSFKDSVKGGSAAAGATVPDKTCLKHRFVHC